MVDINDRDVILANDLPRLIVLCGPCRSGTTALANIFVRAGVESHMQPIKSIRRAKELGEGLVKWEIKNNPSGVIFSKETFGQSLASEFFNPVADLLKLGYPKEKIEVIFIMRDPRQTFASWKRMWGSVEIQNLKKAFLLTEEVREFCLIHGISHSHIVHEAIRDNSSTEVAKSLMLRLGLYNSSSSLTDWSNTPKFGDKDPGNSHLKFYDCPPEVFIDGVRERGAYQFRELPVQTSEKSECDSVPELFKVYESFRRACEKDLGIMVSPIL